jgi:integrase/recombinase XerD
MANLAVSLKMKIKLPNGQRIYALPVEHPNGKLKRFYALVQDKEEHHPEAVYTLVYRENGRLRTRAIGSGADEIRTAKAEQETKLQAIAYGQIKSDVATVDKRRPVEAAIDQYLENTKGKAAKTCVAYSSALAEFTASCKKKYLEQIDREDWIAFIRFLKEQGHAQRTVSNKVSYLKTFFINYKLPIPLQKNDKALFKYVEKKVKAYNQKDLTAFFSKLSMDENDLFKFFLCTGARDAEVQFAFWKDVDFTARTFSVTAKPDLHFKPKDSEERLIPIPQSLADLLRARRERNSHSRLIFPAVGGGVETHFLRMIKNIALENDLNCGDCITKGGLSCKEEPVCEKWQLHRFRKTYATMSHHNGTPVRTIQKRLGHADIETTLLYLADVEDEGEQTRAVLESTFAFLNAS